MKSDWPVLDEVFGGAAIRYGSTREDLTACLEALTPERVAASSRAMRDVQQRTDWGVIASETWDLLDELARQ